MGGRAHKHTFFVTFTKLAVSEIFVFTSQLAVKRGRISGFVAVFASLSFDTLLLPIKQVQQLVKLEINLWSGAGIRPTE